MSAWLITDQHCGHFICVKRISLCVKPTCNEFSLPDCRSGSKTAEQNGVKLKKFGEAVPEWLNTVSMEQWFDTQNNWAK